MATFALLAWSFVWARRGKRAGAKLFARGFFSGGRWADMVINSALIPYA